MEKRELKRGDIVQVNPESQLGEKNGFFAACLVVVDEIKGFGIQGFVMVPDTRGALPKRAFCRFNWADIELVGHCEWTPKDEDDEPTRTA